MLEANCSPYHGNVALWPVGRMLEQLLGFYPDQPAEERLTALQAQLLSDAGLARPMPCRCWPHCSAWTTDERWSRPEVDALALRQQTLQALVTWLAHTAAIDADPGRGPTTSTGPTRPPSTCWDSWPPSAFPAP